MNPCSLLLGFQFPSRLSSIAFYGSFLLHNTLGQDYFKLQSQSIHSTPQLSFSHMRCICQRGMTSLLKSITKTEDLVGMSFGQAHALLLLIGRLWKMYGRTSVWNLSQLMCVFDSISFSFIFGNETIGFGRRSGHKTFEKMTTLYFSEHHFLIIKAVSNHDYKWETTQSIGVFQ